MLIIFFDSQGAVHKEFVLEGKTVNAEFYEAATDRLLKRIQQVRPAAFCCRDFSCCTIMRPPTDLRLPIFDPKNVTTLYHSPYSPYLSAYFLFPKSKMQLKGLHFADIAEFQKAVN